MAKDSSQDRFQLVAQGEECPAGEVPTLELGGDIRFLPVPPEDEVREFYRNARAGGDADPPGLREFIQRFGMDFFLDAAFSSAVGQNARIEDAEHKARTDSMTGLLNKQAFLEEMAAQVSELARTGDRQLVIVNLDLNRFKELNDTQGHAAGDAALRHFATMLRGAVRPYDRVCRAGGDEFLAMLIERRKPGQSNREVAEQVKVRLTQELSRFSFGYRGGSYPLTASIGCIAVSYENLQHRRNTSPENGATVLIEQAMSVADKLMYRAKKRSKKADAPGQEPAPEAPESGPGLVFIVFEPD